MQWNANENAGFTGAGVTPWLPINDNYLTVNVEEQTLNQSSHLAIYQGMLDARLTDLDQTFKKGYVNTQLKNQMLAIGRFQDNLFLTSYATVVNFGDFEDSIDIYGQFQPTFETGQVLVSALGEAGNHPAG